MRIFSKLVFRNPEPNAIVILYPEDYWIRKLILRDINATTLPLFPVYIHLTLAILVRFLFRLSRINWPDIKIGNMWKNLLRQLYAQYIMACIDQTKAKLVLTNIDNSSIFHCLSRLDSERIYFAIQNGIRTPYCVRYSLPSPPHPLSNISMTNFFCFGQRDIDLFSSHGHKIDNFIPVGSLLGGYFNSVVAGNTTSRQFDLCLISQWKEHFFSDASGNEPDTEYLKRVREGVRALNELLLRLLNDTGFSMVICPRGNSKKESAFFEAYFGNRATLAQRDRENFSTYRTVKQSGLALAMSSTILAEFFATGQKVLWCNIPNDEYYAMPSAGISYFCGDDYNAFKERVMALVKMPQEDYERSSSNSARYINNYDSAQPPHEMIRSAILETMGKTA